MQACESLVWGDEIRSSFVTTSHLRDGIGTAPHLSRNRYSVVRLTLSRRAARARLPPD